MRLRVSLIAATLIIGIWLATSAWAAPFFFSTGTPAKAETASHKQVIDELTCRAHTISQSRSTWNIPGCPLVSMERSAT